MGYAELRTKSAFSFLRGASLPEELCERAAELGLDALALSDLSSLSGIVRAHSAARRCGLKLIIGAELEPVDAPPLLLYAMNRRGYGGLCRIITRGRLRAEKGSCRLELQDILERPEGLLALSLARRCDAASKLLAEAFEGHLYVNVERHFKASDARDAEASKKLARAIGCPLIATNDVHIHQAERQALQDVSTCIREGLQLSRAGRALFPNAERRLKSEAEMRACLEGFAPGAVARSVELAERCSFSLDELRTEYPRELHPDGQSSSEYLRHLTLEGARRRYPQGLPGKVASSLEHELQLVSELGYEPYFLTVNDIVGFARERGILCQGRGSAANSAICYCLGVTEVDPERHALLFERFISSAREEPPDIDVDFEHERREEVIQYVYERYGRTRTGMTAAVIRYRRRSALRDVGKVFGLARESLDRLVNASAAWSQDSPSAADLSRAGFDPRSARLQAVLRYADELRGFPRHLSQHVGGLVITHDRLDELVPIENAAMPGRTVIGWDKDDLGELGILKVDILALGMLSCLRRALQLIDAPAATGQPSLTRLSARSPRLALAAVMATDPGGSGEAAEPSAVYEMLSKADTVGVFQVESRAQRAMLPRLEPRCFYDLVIEVALVRPGPIQGGMVNPYVRRRQGEAWDYPAPCTAAVLERTLGVPLFQEQVMSLAMVAAGYDAEEADALRRAMGAWRRHGKLEEHRHRLLEGFARNGIEAELGEQIFRQIQGFGEYGFPESHAASFAILVYLSAWLKRFFPAAFTTALLNSQPMGFYSPGQLLRDAREHGVEVLGVDINASDWDCRLTGPARRSPLKAPPELWGRDGPALRLGLRCVRGLGHQAGQRVERARRAGGPFKSPLELRERAQLSEAQLKALARSDAFCELGLSRREASWQAIASDPLPLFAGLAPSPAPPLPEATEAEDIFADLEQLGLTLRRHPVALIREELTALGARSARELRDSRDGETLTLAGLATLRQRPSTARGVVFLSLEDEHGSMSIIVPPRLAEEARHELSASLLLARGVVERAGEVIHLLAHELRALPGLLPGVHRPGRDFR